MLVLVEVGSHAFVFHAAMRQSVAFMQSGFGLAPSGWRYSKFTSQTCENADSDSGNGFIPHREDGDERDD